MELYRSENSSITIKTPGQCYVVDLQLDPAKPGPIMTLDFQNGAVNVVGGRNGLQNEELLVILIDRMNYLQGLLPCKENEMAIVGLEIASNALLARGVRRKQEGVEGANLPHA